MRGPWIGLLAICYLVLGSSFTIEEAAAEEPGVRKWHAGIELSYIDLLEISTALPLYSAQVQYILHPSWTLHGSLGITRGVLGLRMSTPVFYPRTSSHWIVPDQKIAAFLMPFQVRLTRYLPSVPGHRSRGYIGAGFGLCLVSTGDVYGEISHAHAHLTHRTGLLIGPVGSAGVSLPLRRKWMMDIKVVECTYYRSFNAFLSPVEGFMFGMGIGLRR
jgi:hypothetical protein